MHMKQRKDEAQPQYTAFRAQIIYTMEKLQQRIISMKYNTIYHIKTEIFTRTQPNK